MGRVIKAIKLLNKELEKSSKSEFDAQSEEKKEKVIISLDQTIEVPSEFYYSRMVDNIRSIKVDYRFRSTKLNEIHSNISIIDRMLVEENRSLKYVAKWLRIPAKNIISTLRTYYKTLKRSKNIYDKQQIKHKRILAAKDKIDSFMRSRAGR